MPVATNIVIFEVDQNGCARELAQQLKEKGILAIAIAANQIRFVTHLDISPAMADEVVDVIEQL